MKKLIIVGAGIAGLTAGVYALQSGFDVTIYESHNIPGGASTSWKRKGYLFEGGMHWLTGSSPKMPLYKVWREVGALKDNVPIYNRDPFFTYEYNGQRACLYRDLDQLREHLLKISPEDKAEILSLCRDIKKFTKISMPILDIKDVKVKNKSSMPLTSVIGMIPAIPRMKFYGNQTAGEYAMRFKSPLLQFMFQNLIGPDSSARGLVFTMATLASGDGGYPEGGSLGMANRIAENYNKLGGKILYGKTVNKVRVLDGIARGIVADGEDISADAVIVTQDTLVAIDNLFETPIREDWAERMRRDTSPMLNTFICLGVKADLSDIPENITFTLDEPIFCGDVPITVCGINNYSGYKDYAPVGCTAVTSTWMADTYDFWKDCKQKGCYDEEKKKLANAFIAMLSNKYPKIAGKIEVWDVATPLTYERYLKSYKGSWMSIMKKGSKMSGYPSKPESIQNVYFAGQRVSPPGGLPIAVETGRKAVQYLCRDNDMVFQGKL